MEPKIALDASPSQREKDVNGYMHVYLTPISKATVNPYLGREIPGWQELDLKPDTIYHGLRDPTELEKAAQTFNGLPLLLDHSPDSAADPQKDYRVGATGDQAVFEAPYLKNSIHVQDAEAVRAIEDGTYKELSCAYFYTPDFTPGTYDGTKYDFVMREIRGNHVALVKQGRAGSDVAVADAMPSALNIKLNEKETDMRILKKLKRRWLALDNAMKEANIDDESVKDAAEELSEALDEATEPIEDNDIDLSQPIDDIIQQNAGDLDASHALIKKLLTKIQGGQTAEDEEEEEEEKKAPPTAQDNNLDALIAALKEIPQEELWAAFNGLSELANKEKTQEVLGKLAAAFNGVTPDSGETVEEKKDVLTAQDTNAIIAKATQNAREEVLASVKKRTDAANECRHIIGNIDALTFDSAESIYGKALSVAGINPKPYPKEAWRGMVAAYKQAKPTMDGKPFDPASHKSDVNLDRLNKITVL